MSDKSNKTATRDASVLEVDGDQAGAGQSGLYRELMRFRPEGVTANAWAVQAGVSRTVWADMRRHGNPSRRTLEKLLAAAGSSLAEFEALRIGDNAGPDVSVDGRVGDFARRGWGQGHVPSMPLIASSLAGEWGKAGSGIELVAISPNEILGQVAKPTSFLNDGSSYALTIVGDAMWPRFRPGRLVAVSPKAPIAIGDDVLVRLGNAGEGTMPALIKSLVRRTGAAIELRQFNPDMTFMVEAGEVDAMHRIAGELI